MRIQRNRMMYWWSLATLLFILSAICFMATAQAATAQKSLSYMAYDAGTQPIQGFAPDLTRTKIPVSVEAAATYDVDVTGWLAICFRAAGAIQVYMNDQTTKYMTFDSESPTVIVIPRGTTSIHFKNATGDAISVEVWGQ